MQYKNTSFQCKHLQNMQTTLNQCPNARKKWVQNEARKERTLKSIFRLTVCPSLWLGQCWSCDCKSDLWICRTVAGSNLCTSSSFWLLDEKLLGLEVAFGDIRLFSNIWNITINLIFKYVKQRWVSTFSYKFKFRIIGRKLTQTVIKLRN